MTSYLKVATQARTLGPLVEQCVCLSERVRWTSLGFRLSAAAQGLLQPGQ